VNQFVRLVWSTYHRHCHSCISTTSTGTSHSSRQITRSVRSGICSSTSTAFGPSISHRFGSTRNTTPDHILAEARPLVCFDMVCNRVWGCGCNHHHDSCNLTEVSYIPTTWNNTSHLARDSPSATFSPCHPSSYGQSYLLYHYCGGSARRRWISRSHPRYCPVFLNACTSCLKLSWPVIRPYILSALGKRLMVSCIRLQVYRIVLFPDPCLSQSNPSLAPSDFDLQSGRLGKISMLNYLSAYRFLQPPI